MTFNAHQRAFAHALTKFFFWDTVCNIAALFYIVMIVFWSITDNAIFIIGFGGLIVMAVATVMKFAHSWRVSLVGRTMQKLEKKQWEY